MKTAMILRPNIARAAPQTVQPLWISLANFAVFESLLFLFRHLHSNLLQARAAGAKAAHCFPKCAFRAPKSANRQTRGAKGLPTPLFP